MGKTTRKDRPTLTDSFVRSVQPQEKAREIRDAKLPGFLLRVQPSGRMSFYVQYSRGRRMLIGRADVIKAATARAKAIMILGDVAKDIDPMAAKKKAKEVKADEVPTLESYVVDTYAPWVDANPDHKNGEATIKLLTAHFLPTMGKCRLNEITTMKAHKWRLARAKAGIKPSTLNRYLNSLKAALARAADTFKIIKENPLADMKMLKIDSTPKTRYLSDDEEDRLRAALDNREARARQERATANVWRQERGYDLLPDLTGRYTDLLKPLVLLSLSTGCRRGELLSLERADVDIKRGTITIKGTTAKSGQTRYSHLNSEAKEVLRTWLKQSTGELVFAGQNGEKVTSVKSAWRNLMRDAQISGFRWHDMRHHFASRLVMAGVDLNTVRELLGHKDIAMTLRYAHLAPAVKAAAVEAIVRT